MSKPIKSAPQPGIDPLFKKPLREEPQPAIAPAPPARTEPKPAIDPFPGDKMGTSPLAGGKMLENRLEGRPATEARVAQRSIYGDDGEPGAAQGSSSSVNPDAEALDRDDRSMQQAVNGVFVFIAPVVSAIVGGQFGIVSSIFSGGGPSSAQLGLAIGFGVGSLISAFHIFKEAGTP